MRLRVLLMSSLASFMTPFMVSSLYVALPTISKDLNADAVQMSWVSLGYLLAAAMFLIPFGRLSDIHGRRKIFTYGILIFILTSLLSSVAPTIELLILFRVLEGIGGAMIFGTGVAMLSAAYGRDKGKALGINVASVYTGLSLGPLIGGIITENLGWRFLFLLIVPFCLAIIMISLSVRKDWKEAHGESFDLLGSILYMIALSTIIYGLSILPDLSGILGMMIGIPVMVSFIILELKIKEPVFQVRLFKNRTFAFSSMAALITYVSTFAIGYMLSLFLQYAKGISPERAGLILIAQPVAMALFSPVFGRLSDRIEPRTLATAGILIMTAGLFTIAAIGPDTSIRYVIIGLAIIGFGFSVFSSPNMNAIMGSVDKRYLGIAGSTLATMRLLGQMLSMAIATMMLSLIIGKVQITQKVVSDFMTAFSMTFIIFSVLCLTGILISAFRGRLRA